MHIENKEFTESELDQIRLLLEETLIEPDAESVLPASAAQRRLWFIDQLDPNSPRYNIPSIVWLKGELNVRALEQALKNICERHEVLRTRFISEDGEPALVIADENAIRFRHELLSSLPAHERDVVAKRLIEEEARRPFNLSEGGFMRATLLALTPEEHVLIINMHHIVSDEWSFKILYKELETLYSELTKASASSLPPLPIQYSDYAAWQVEWLKTDECQEQLNYWKEQLAGSPEGITVPADRPHIAQVTGKGALELNLLPPEVTRALREVGATQNATLFMVLLAAFKAQLHLLTRQEDVIVGSPMAGRNQAETQPLIGFFANTLPLRTRISPDLPFAEFLRRVRKVVIGAFSHQDVPFETIVEALQPPRYPGRTPFINVLLLFQTDFAPFQLPGLQASFLDTTTDTAKFDLTLYVADMEEALVTAIEYNADMYAAATMQRLLRNFEHLLKAIIRNPSVRISELSLLNEPTSMARQWSPPQQEFPAWDFLDKWFAGRAERAGRSNPELTK